jgi:hypothetical protein
MAHDHRLGCLLVMSFSKLKAYLRNAGERTISRLRRRIGSFARNVTAREAANYFRHGSYP